MRETLKRWMQALAFSGALMIYPVSALWAQDGEFTVEAEEASNRETVADEGEKPRIALTFDDGPNAEYTPILLDGLKERDVKATFFVIGANIEKDDNRSIIRRMKEEGHLIGNHTYHHVNLSGLSGESAAEELAMTEELIREITGEGTSFVRPPFGAFPTGEEETDKLYVKWTVDSEDWATKNTAAAVKKVVTDIEENDIILMHDCYDTSVEAALQIVDILKEKGYDFVTVDELLIE